MEGTLHRTKDPLNEEASKLTKALIKKMHRSYKQEEHRPPTQEEAFDTVSDFSTIHECVFRILQRMETTKLSTST